MAKTYPKAKGRMSYTEMIPKDQIKLHESKKVFLSKWNLGWNVKIIWLGPMESEYRYLGIDKDNMYPSICTHMHTHINKAKERGINKVPLGRTIMM